MTFRERAAKYKANIPIIILGVFYIGYAAMNFLSAKLNQFIIGQDSGGVDLDEMMGGFFSDTIKMVNENMPWLLAIGVAFISLGFIFHRSKNIIIPLFFLLAAVLIYWTMGYASDTKAIMDKMMQAYDEMGIYDNASGPFAKIMENSLKSGTVTAYVYTIGPMLIAGFLSFWVFRKKEEQV